MASKSDLVFFCKNCGYESLKWVGQCPSCKEWNTMTEAPSGKKGKPERRTAAGIRTELKPLTLDEIELDEEERTTTGIAELDRVLGGGIVRGSLILVGGDPGIGKSTLLLQVCRNLTEKGTRVMYISGEESASQIKMRAVRIGSFNDKLKVACDTSLDEIVSVIEKNRPDAVVIDSIQTMVNESVNAAAGSVSQVRESTGVLMRVAKGLGVTVFIVGHVTKDGAVAGPRVLEHMVDTVLYFEGDVRGTYRILRGVKNRFGSTDEIGVFEMFENGLGEVANPSEYLLSGRAEQASGNVVTCTIEGTRPLLVEIQALVCDKTFDFPKRQATGLDFNRVSLLMAVLEKRVGMHLGLSDAYVNIAGGLKLSEPASDLGLVIAVVSSYRDRPVDPKLAAFGEVGLNGEVRAVSMCDRRVNEAKKMGFSTVIVPKANHKSIENIKGIEIIEASSVEDAIRLI
ncbi:MAG: DNA repair protein RadA [Lachnospiraceae bacterium]|nr:DNA repair protein RadA [Lachnospiraceae bacterium]